MMCFGLLIMFCEVQEPPKSVTEYCLVAKPIYISRQDTRETKEQTDAHNRVWKALCKKK